MATSQYETLVAEELTKALNKLERIANALPPVHEATEAENYIRNVLAGYSDEELG